MIPDMLDIGSTWHVVSPGVHDCTLGEVRDKFVINEKRRELYEGLSKGCDALKQAGCTQIYLDGSFITSKPLPNDFDVCWDPAGVQANMLDPVFLDFSNQRRRQKEKYGGEFFPSRLLADGIVHSLNFFKLIKRLEKGRG